VTHDDDVAGYQTSNTQYTSGSQQVFLSVAGFPGYRGLTGAEGATGNLGTTGFQGVTGPYGATGPLGLPGPTGLQGPQGETGTVGLTGAQGKGETGLPGVTGLQGPQGDLGLTGPPGKGETGLPGPQGETGASGETGVASLVNEPEYNGISRYQAVSTSGEEVWVLSSSTVYSHVSWSRSGTTLTISSPAHGHSMGNKVIIRNTNKDYQALDIVTTSTNSFTVTTTNTGGTSGTNASYSLGFSYGHVGAPKTGGVLSAPSGPHADAQLISLRIRTGSRAGTTYDLVVPASAVNGAGENTDLSDCYVPDINVRTDSYLLTAIGVTMRTNIGGSYSTFRFGNLGTGSQSRIITLNF
jgi:hypothetical protein